MRFLIIVEVLILLLSPFPLAILRRRGKEFDKPIAITLATLFGLLIGTTSLYTISSENLNSLTLSDWLLAFTLAVLSWLFIYLGFLLLYKQWFQK